MTQSVPIYIHGISLACALGHNEAQIAKTLFAKDRLVISPQSLSFSQADEQYHTEYFSTFEKPLLTEMAIFEIIERHVIAAIEHAGWEKEALAEVPILIGSTSYSMSDKENNLQGIQAADFVDICYEQIYCLNSIADFFAQKHGNLNVFSFATSCTSSSNALIYGQRFLNSGYFERAIVVGFESHNALTIQGFHALSLLTKAGAWPFSKQSEGLVLGEGIAAIALSQQPLLETQKSQLKDCFTLMGGASLCDPHNIAATQSEGDKVSELIQKVLDQANIKADQILCVKAHATGSKMSDQAEIQGILKAFSRNIPIVALKPYIGHTLGACGALECALLIMALKQGHFPALPIQACDVNCTDLPVRREMMKRDLPLNLMSEGMALTSGYYLLSYLGFGGSNTALILGFNQGLSQ